MCFVYMYDVENGVNERMKRIVIDGCMQTSHNDVIGNRKKRKRKKEAECIAC